MGGEGREGGCEWGARRGGGGRTLVVVDVLLWLCVAASLRGVLCGCAWLDVWLHVMAAWCVVRVRLAGCVASCDGCVVRYAGVLFLADPGCALSK